LNVAADFRFQMMHRAGKAVGRQPFRERIRFQERAIDFLRAWWKERDANARYWAWLIFSDV
jgi:hypothetical protein